MILYVVSVDIFIIFILRHIQRQFCSIRQMRADGKNTGHANDHAKCNYNCFFQIKTSQL